MNNAFALSGRLIAITFPRALPWAKGFWAFSPRKPFDLYSVGGRAASGSVGVSPAACRENIFLLLR